MLKKIASTELLDENLNPALALCNDNSTRLQVRTLARMDALSRRSQIGTADRKCTHQPPHRITAIVDFSRDYPDDLIKEVLEDAPQIKLF